MRLKLSRLCLKLRDHKALCQLVSIFMFKNFCRDRKSKVCFLGSIIHFDLIHIGTWWFGMVFSTSKINYTSLCVCFLFIHCFVLVVHIIVVLFYDESIECTSFHWSTVVFRISLKQVYIVYTSQKTRRFTKFFWSKSANCNQIGRCFLPYCLKESQTFLKPLKKT